MSYPGQRPATPQTLVATDDPMDRPAGPVLWLVFTAVIVVACAGIGVMAYFATTAAQTQAWASASASGEPQITLRRPANLMGWPEIDTAEARAKAEELEKSVTETLGEHVDQVIVNAYGNIEEHRLRLIVAMKAPMPAKPDAVVTVIMPRAVRDAHAIVTVPAGPLGGAAQCGEVGTGRDMKTVCVWADGGSAGIVTFFGERLAAAKAVFVQIRGEIELKA